MGEHEHWLEAILVDLRYIRDDVRDNNELVRETNGRLREAETEIAVLKDRSGEAKRAGGIAGTLGGFLGGFVATLAGSLFKS